MTTGPQRRPTMYTRPFSEPGEKKEASFSKLTPMEFSSPQSWDRFAVNPVINGQQVRTLLDPVEHWERVTHSIDLGFGESTIPDLRSMKEEEARTDPETSYGNVHGAGIYDWMKRGDRQRTPIEVRLPFSSPESYEEASHGYGQGEGHHRAAAGAAIQEETGTPRPVKFEAHRMHYLGREDEDRVTPFSQRPSPQPLKKAGTTTWSRWDKALGSLEPGTTTGANMVAQALGSNIKRPDSSLERLLNDEESIARKMRKATPGFFGGPG